MPKSESIGHSWRPLARALTSGTALLLLVTGCSTATPPQLETPAAIPTTRPTEATPDPEETPEPQAITTDPELPAIPEPPVLPAAAKENTEEGALAFTKFFLETVTYSLNTLDPAPLRMIAAPGCGYCDGVETYIKDIASGEGWLEDYSVNDLETSIHTKKHDQLSLEVSYRTSRYSVFDGRSLVVYEPSSTTAGAIILWEDSWKLVELGEIE